MRKREHRYDQRQGVLGRWSQGVLTSRDQLTVVALLTIQTVIVAADFLRAAELDGVDYRLIDSAAAEAAWGFGFLGSALLVVVGIVLKRHLLVFLGHGLLFLMWALFGVGVSIAILGSDGWSQGWRAGFNPLAVAGIHLLIALRTGPTPLHTEDPTTVPVEAIAGPLPTRGDGGEKL